MIVLDTNVVSEAMKPQMDKAVQSWLDMQNATNLYMTATSLAKLKLGIEIAPIGRRKAFLVRALEKMLVDVFEDRILAFDVKAAKAYAESVGRARLLGRAIDIADGQIAAIAQVHKFTVATRDTAPFEAAGVPFLNPWNS